MIPNLFLVRKIGSGESLGRKEMIPPAMRNLFLRRFFTGEGMSPEDYQTITKFLHVHREMGHWIACGCNPNGEAAFTIKMLNERIYIAAIPTRKKHAPDCPFAREIIITIPSPQKQPESKGDSLLENGGVLNLHLYLSSEPRSDSFLPSLTGASWREPKLLRILWTLVNNERLNVITRSPLQIDDQLARLHAATSPYYLDRDLRLTDYFGVAFSNIRDIKAKLIESRNKWSNCRPHGVILARCKDIEDRTLILSDKFKFPLKRLSRPGLERTSGPFVSLFTIAESPERIGSGWFEGMSGAACPIADWNTLIPVESHNERVALSRLRWYFHQSKAALPDVVITKPLMDVYDDSGEIPLRPDFLIKRGNRQVVLEVMGFDDAAYKDRKDRTIPLMQKRFGEVFKYDAFNPDSEGKEFFQIMRSIRIKLN